MNRVIYRQGSERLQQGFTLIELLIAMAIFSVVLAVAFNLFSSTNRLVEADTGRLMATQNVQSAMDIMVNDVRQAGENLVSQGLAVTGLEFDSAQQQLVIRRAVPAFRASELPTGYAGTGSVSPRKICNVLGASVEIASNNNGCIYTPVNNAAASSEDTGVVDWRQQFVLQDSRPQAALLYRPAGGANPQPLVASVTVNSVGGVIVSGTAGSYNRRVSVTLSSNVPTGFTAANGSVLILVDERRYRVNTATQELLFSQGGANSPAQTMAFGISSLQISAFLNGPDQTITALGLTSGAPLWSRVRSINLQMTGMGGSLGRATQKTFNATVFPRNVESARGVGP